MTPLLVLAAVALLWSFLAGEVTPANLLVGAAFGLLLLSVVPVGDARAFPRRVAAFARFLLRFAFELIVSNVAIALLALRLRPRLHPHVLAVPLRVRSEGAITLLSLAITLLPGTIAMGVDDARTTLYAHAVGEPDPDRARAAVQRIETRILAFMDGQEPEAP